VVRGCQPRSAFSGAQMGAKAARGVCRAELHKRALQWSGLRPKFSPSKAFAVGLSSKRQSHAHRVGRVPKARKRETFHSSSSMESLKMLVSVSCSPSPGLLRPLSNQRTAVGKKHTAWVGHFTWVRDAMRAGGLTSEQVQTWRIRC